MFEPFKKRKRGKVTEKALFKIMQYQSERNTAWTWSLHGWTGLGEDAGVKELVVQVLKVGTNLDGKTSLSLSDGFCWHECELGGIGAGIGALNPCKVEDIHEGCLLSLNGVMFTGTLSDAVIVQPGCVCCTAAELEERASSAADVYQKMRDVNGNDIKLFNEYDLPNEDRKVTKLLRGDNTGTGTRAARAGRTAPAASAGAGANAAGRGKLSKEEREADEARRKLQEEEEKAAREQRKREREEEKKRKEAEKAEKESARRAAQRAKKKSTEPGAGGRAGAPGGPGDAAPSIEVVEETRTPEELDEISFANLQAIVTGFKDRGVVAETNEVKRRIREKRRERHAAAEARHRERAEAEAKAAEEAAAAAALAAVEEAEEDADRGGVEAPHQVRLGDAQDLARGAAVLLHRGDARARASLRVRRRHGKARADVLAPATDGARAVHRLRRGARRSRVHARQGLRHGGLAETRPGAVPERALRARGDVLHEGWFGVRGRRDARARGSARAR